jgi:hypothetical protein
MTPLRARLVKATAVAALTAGAVILAATVQPLGADRYQTAPSHVGSSTQTSSWSPNEDRA